MRCGCPGVSPVGLARHSKTGRNMDEGIGGYVYARQWEWAIITKCTLGDELLMRQTQQDLL